MEDQVTDLSIQTVSVKMRDSSVNNPSNITHTITEKIDDRIDEKIE